MLLALCEEYAFKCGLMCTIDEKTRVGHSHHQYGQVWPRHGHEQPQKERASQNLSRNSPAFPQTEDLAEFGKNKTLVVRCLSLLLIPGPAILQRRRKTRRPVPQPWPCWRCVLQAQIGLGNGRRLKPQRR